MAAKAKAKTETVTCTATCHLSEAGTHYRPGDTFEATPERAEALGPAVDTGEAPTPPEG
jgi:hypothetical protein